MTLKAPPQAFETGADIVVIGAGAAGLCAALASREAGAEVVLIERDFIPRGSTALSAGLIPAAGTRFQRRAGIADESELFARDIQSKAHGEADEALVRLVARESGPTVEWLADSYGLPFSVVGDFDYPGHSARRMHGLPTRSGVELVDQLRSAAERCGATLLCCATAVALYVDDDKRVRGVEMARAGGAHENIGCSTLCSPAVAMAAILISSPATFQPCAARSISATPAIAATPCYGAKRWAQSSRTFRAIRATARSRIRMGS